MRNLIAPMIAAALVLTFSLQPVAMAQGESSPSANELESFANQVRTGLVTSTPNQIYERLTPGRKGEIDMLQARAKRSIANEQLAWKDLDKILHRKNGFDPARKLGLKDAEGFAALGPAQFCCLFLGLYKVAADDSLAAKMKDQWFMTRRAVGSIMTDMDVNRNPLNVLTEMGGEVHYESIDGLKVRVTCVAEGRVWLVHDITIEVPNKTFTLSHALGNVAKIVMGVDEDVRGAKASEGEQMLGSFKNMARVAFAKNATAPTKLTGELTDSGALATDALLDGKYYKVRDAVYGNDTWGALVAEPKTATDTWILLVFLWATGKGETKSYESKDVLETGLAELNREGYDPPQK